MYSETWKEHVYCHPLFIIKQHKEKDTVFSLALKENIVIVKSNYLKQVVIIQLQSTAAMIYRKKGLVKQSTNVLLSTKLPIVTNCASQLVALPTLLW
jgi:hypothetical protein